MTSTLWDAKTLCHNFKELNFWAIQIYRNSLSDILKLFCFVLFSFEWFSFNHNSTLGSVLGPEVFCGNMANKTYVFFYYFYLLMSWDCLCMTVMSLFKELKFSQRKTRRKNRLIIEMKYCPKGTSGKQTYHFCQTLLRQLFGGLSLESKYIEVQDQ